MHGIDVSSGPISHGGTGISVTILENFRDRVFAGAVLTQMESAITQVHSFTAAPNPSNGHLSLMMNAHQGAKAEFVLSDALGRELMAVPANATGRTEIDWAVPGWYWVALRVDGRSLDVQRIVIAR